MIKELKKELSALSGVDFFNPKFREVFKRYFPNDNEEVAAEEERLNEMVEEPVVEAAEEVVEEKAEEIVEDTQPTEESTNNEVVEDKVEEVAEEVSEPTIEEEPSAEEVVDMVDDKIEETVDDHKELIDAKVELELVKSGVREDRLEPAKKLLMSEIKTMEDVNKVKELIKQYPEWLHKERPMAKPIGMVLDNAGDGLTEEEKKLKQMGIDPR